MGLKNIQFELERIAYLVSGWEKMTSVSDIERELVLDKLKRLYEEVMFFDRERMCEGGGASDATRETDTAIPPVVVESTLPDQKVERNLTERAVGESTNEESVCEQSPVEPQLFDESEMAPRTAGRRQVILSLYGETRSSAPKIQNTIVPDMASPKVGPMESVAGGEPAMTGVETGYKRVLGEVIGNATTSVGDDFALHNEKTDLASVMQSAPVDSLRRAIGVNDRFLLIRDLFAGSGAAYEEAIGRLDEFTDLDEALIFIQEHYAWNPDGEATRMVIDLLTRKLS